ncbi:T9SS type A sorting domain-containing protein [bacterium]|nr:T9SS type A sorting domain-containing protein [bacterium]
MQRLVLSLVWVLLIGLVAFGSPVEYERTPTASEDGSHDVVINPDLAPWTGSFRSHNELNEIIGDTMIVGTSYWDQQHNGQVSRMIGFFPGDAAENPAEVHIIFTKLYGSVTSNSRHVQFVRLTDDGAGWYIHETTGDVDTGNRSGYTTIAFDYAAGVTYPTFHYDATAGAETASVIALESEFVTGFYDMYAAPEYGTRAHIWPHSTFSPATQHAHIISHDQRDDNADPMEITYMRWLYDPNVPEFAEATPNDLQVLITDGDMNISGDITTSSDGQRVAIGLVMARESTIGEVVGDGEGTQWNNDFWVFESTNAGATWDQENPIEVTSHIGPDPDLYPDTLAALGDTLRPYTDGSVIYDSDDQLHVAFTSAIYDGLEDTRYYAARLYHWMQDESGNPVYSQIDENSEFDVGQSEAWGSLVDRPSLYHDPETGILWCTYRKISSAPDTADYGQGGIKANGDIYVSASPPGEFNGLRWAKGVNITNTIWTEGGGAPPGDSRSEISPSIAPTSHGDYLHLLYMVDRDPGVGVSSSAPVGEILENPMVYHRLSKQMMIDIFEERQQWQVNYPMMRDSTGYWVDPDDWQWNGFFGDNSVGHSNTLQPDQFELGQNYPNPFNPSTQIAFNLRQAGQVKLAVYDLLGREVATLVERGMSAGNHTITFLADDLPSGVYFYKLTSGDVSKVRKMVLMK